MPEPFLIKGILNVIDSNMAAGKTLEVIYKSVIFKESTL
jgi:hypothetical protein